MEYNKNTYSLFITKPGFVNKQNLIEKILNKNNIVVVKKEEQQLLRSKVELHYAEHEGKNFYTKLVNYMTNGVVEGLHKFDPTCVVMVVASANKNETEENFITRSREVVKTQLRPALEFNRRDFNLSDADFNELTKTANGIHASDSPASAKREIKNLCPSYNLNDDLSF